MADLDYKNIIAEYIAHNAFDIAINKIKQSIEISNQKYQKEFSDEKSRFSYILSEDDIISQLMHHLKVAINWCEEVNFRDLQQAKKISDIFIQLDFYLSPKRTHFDLGKDKTTSLNALLQNENKNIIILGPPGAGKTTLSKYICKMVLSKEEILGNKFISPIVLKFRDIPVSYQRSDLPLTFYYYLMEYFGIQIEFPFSNDVRIKEIQIGQYYNLTKRIITELIEDLNILLILDGLDELPGSENQKNIIKEVQELSLSLNNSRFLLTSRTGEFNFTIKNATIYEICSLSQVQIKELVNKWLKSPTESSDLLKKIFDSPFADTSIRPLNIAHLCAIYERYKKIPDRPKSVYRKIISLLLEEWDAQRSIERSSRYRNFDVDRKIEFLSNLAYLITTEYGRTIFDKNILLNCYSRLCIPFDLPPNQAQQVVDEIESHSGLFIQTGYDTFAFSHKSIQEFLTAEYIAKLPTIPEGIEFLEIIPNEIAITVALSSNPNIYFSTLVFNRVKYNLDNAKFIKTFLSRLLIEKPDFNDNPMLAVAIAYINQKVLRIKEEGVIKPSVFAEMQELLLSPSVSMSFKKLHDLYEIPKYARGSNFLFIIHKKPRLVKYQFKLPNILFLNDTMHELTK